MNPAELYISLGWFPIPMVHRTKRPMVKFAHLADAAELPVGWADMWNRNPDLGVALLLKPSRLLVVDCDSLAALEESLAKSPPTLCVTTRQGAHLYYRNPWDVNARAIHRGASGRVDILSAGYVLAPPSIHPTGKRYEWANTRQLADAPDWALEALQQARQRDSVRVSADTVHRLLNESVRPVEWMRVRAVNPKVHRFLSDGIPVGSDRSRELWVCINTLVRLGYSDAQIFQTVWNSPAGEKPRQKGAHWFAGEIMRAREELQP